MPPCIQTMNLFIKVLQWSGMGNKTILFLICTKKNVLSKIYMSFDSPPNGYMGRLIHWSTETIASLKMSSLKNSKNIHKHR